MFSAGRNRPRMIHCSTCIPTASRKRSPSSSAMAASGRSSGSTGSSEGGRQGPAEPEHPQNGPACEGRSPAIYWPTIAWFDGAGARSRSASVTDEAHRAWRPRPTSRSLNQSRHRPSKRRWGAIQRGAMIEGRADFAERGFNDRRHLVNRSLARETRMKRGAGWRRADRPPVGRGDGGWRGAWLGWRFAIFMALLPVDSAEAGSNQGTTTGPADAGPVISLAVDPSAPETVYAGTGHTATLAGTVFKSTNGGASWAPANSGLPDLFIRALVIDPQTPSTIYAGTSGGVFKSVN